MTLTVCLSVLIGMSLGLLGGGGSILTVPILVYVAGIEPRSGIATSLLVVGATSFAGMLFHARAGRVVWRVGLLFGVASMGGAYAGGRLAHVLPARTLLSAFTIMMVVTALAMMRRRREATPGEVRAPRSFALLRATAVGVSIGTLTGVIGAGGGFVIVPALVLLSGLPMRAAVGTSLLVIALNSFAGFAGAVGHVTIDGHLAVAVTAASIVGSLVGAALAGKVRPDSLRTGFAWFVLTMALVMGFKQVPASWRSLLADHAALGATMLGTLAIVVGTAAVALRRRSSVASASP